MTLLLLAGTREARLLAKALAARGIGAVASLAGATERPAELAVPVRAGGFGGADGFREYLRAAGISAVIDATHPFATQITPRTVAVCADAGVPYLRLERPGWSPEGDWRLVDRAEDVAGAIAPDAVVFLATGRQSLPGFAGLGDRIVYLRQIDPPDRDFPFAQGGYVIGRPPFSVEHEVATLRRLGVTDLVVKDAGGKGGRAKLDAAGRLGVQVWLIRRPPLPAAERVETVEEALIWAVARCG